MATTVYSGGRVFRLKQGVTFDQYLSMFPDAVKVGEIPSMEELEEMVSDGIAEAVDGCGGIEIDGHCEHGFPSWLMVLGWI